MKYKYKLLLICILAHLLICIPIFAQQNNIDSLLTLLKTDKADTNKVIHLNKLSWEYRNIGNFDSAAYYGNEALQLGIQLNFQKGIATSYSTIGMIFFNQGDYSKALKNHFAALKIREEINDKQGTANSYNNIGLIYIDLKNYDKALKNFIVALKLQKEVGSKQGIALAYSNIGIIYISQENFSKALENFSAALKIQKEIGRSQDMAITYNNIGAVYFNKKNYDKALENFLASLKIVQEIGDKQKISLDYDNIGRVYRKLKQYKLAKEYTFKALVIAKEIGNKESISTIYLGLSEIYMDMSDYKNAYQYHLLYSQINDSIFNETNSKNIAEMQTKYETEKKEKEIAIQSHKLVEQELLLGKSRLYLGLITIGSVLLIILALVAFSRYKIKKESQVKSEMLEHQDVLTKAIIDTQERERTRIAQDLHDGIGHKLTTLKFNFEKIAEDIRLTSPEQKNILEQTENILDQTHKEVRNLSHSMMPKALQEREFIGAISDLVEQTLDNSIQKYSLKNESPTGLPEDIQVCLYRVLQELLNNILKHAQSTEIAIQIFKNKNNIIMMVEDNGTGIQNGNTENGIGLRNIAGRINALSGIFTIEPGPVKGTIATVRIPLSVE